MPLFETILVLLLVTIRLLQVSRRLGTPYPSLLALAGVGVGMLPGIPYLEIEPHLALALFVAPVLLDAAYDTDPRELRRHWVPLVSLVCGAVVVFLLTVLAFLLMGMQVRGILGHLDGHGLGRDLVFAGVVFVLVVAVRLAWITAYRAMAGLVRWRAMPVPKTSEALLGSWCGMRGIVTLATAYALPASFPGRERIALCAFAVVLGTLVLQGLTLKRLIVRLKIAPDSSLEEEVSRARTALYDGALETLAGRDDEESHAVRREYESARAQAQNPADPQAVTARDRLRAEAIAAQRRVLEKLREEGRVTEDTYHRLEEELDWRELAATPRDRLELQDT